MKNLNQDRINIILSRAKDRLIKHLKIIGASFAQKKEDINPSFKRNSFIQRGIWLNKINIMQENLMSRL